LPIEKLEEFKKWFREYCGAGAAATPTAGMKESNPQSKTLH
jgi:hypothetical protein